AGVPLVPGVLAVSLLRAVAVHCPGGVGGDQVVVDRDGGGEAGRCGADQLRLGVGDVTGDPHPRGSGGAAGVCVDLGSQQVVPDPYLACVQAERGEQVGAGPADRCDDQRVELDAGAVVEQHTGQPGGVRLDL